MTLSVSGRTPGRVVDKVNLARLKTRSHASWVHGLYQVERTEFWHQRVMLQAKEDEDEEQMGATGAARMVSGW